MAVKAAAAILLLAAWGLACAFHPGTVTCTAASPHGPKLAGSMLLWGCP